MKIDVIEILKAVTPIIIAIASGVVAYSKATKDNQSKIDSLNIKYENEIKQINANAEAYQKNKGVDVASDWMSELLKTPKIKTELENLTLKELRKTNKR